jgi:23S rRNA pseudouridine2605 synthase
MGTPLRCSFSRAAYPTGTRRVIITDVKERIQKVLANAGVASRRNIEGLVMEGRIAVNGRVMRELPILIDPQKDKVEVDGEPLKLKRGGGGGGGGGKAGQPAGGARVYLLLNKPRGVYSTNVAQGEQTRAIDLLPPEFSARVYPVGRLDAESRGLLLLTNDGELTNRLTHPRYGVPKIYRAVVDGFLDADATQMLQKGIWLADPKSGKGFKTGRSIIRVVQRGRQKSILEITIREGRNRQIRRMLARTGHKVRELTRVKLGPLTLEGLKPGAFRPLTPREVKQLYKLGEEKAEIARKGTKGAKEEKELDTE